MSGTAAWERCDPTAWAAKRTAARERAKKLREERSRLGSGKPQSDPIRSPRHGEKPVWSYTESPKPGMFNESRTSDNVPGDSPVAIRKRRRKPRQHAPVDVSGTLDWDPVLSQVLELHAQQCEQEEIIRGQLAKIEGALACVVRVSSQDRLPSCWTCAGSVSTNSHRSTSARLTYAKQLGSSTNQRSGRRKIEKPKKGACKRGGHYS
jgi:hypothetical protein